MGAMNEFLQRLATPAFQAIYRDADTTWNARAQALNAALEQAGAPARIANLGSVWSVWYAEPGRYHWMFQYYLRAHGLALSWVGTGRFIFTLAYTAGEYAEVERRFLAAAREMQADGWWWRSPGLDARVIRRSLVRELLRARWSRGPSGR
jgi:glutamate-1-semialdehyde 2,1-aminomutase